MQTTLHIKGMSCGHCSARVMDALKAVNGVAEVAVSLEEKLAVVDFDETAVSRAQLVETVENTGYDVVG